MSLIFKSYDPVRHQQRARRRQQKRSAERSTHVPLSATSIDTPSPQPLVAGLECSRVDEKFIPSINPDGPEYPYSGYPSVEEILEFCSSLDTDVSSVYTPTSANPLSYPDSAIDIQDINSDSSFQEEAYMDDQLRRKLLGAIAIMPLASDSNIGREAHNANTSSSPASTTVSAGESDTGISPAEHVWSSDAEIPSSIAPSISTPALATSPTYQQQIFTWRNQDSSVDSEDGAQDSCPQMADLGVPDAISKYALSGVGPPVLESLDNIAPEPSISDSSIRTLTQNARTLRIRSSAAIAMEESSTKPSSVKEIPTPDVRSSSTKRSSSESDVIGDSQPSDPEVCPSPKRLRRSRSGPHLFARRKSDSIYSNCVTFNTSKGNDQVVQHSGGFSPQCRPDLCAARYSVTSEWQAKLTSIPVEEAVSTLRNIQMMISSVLAKLDNGPPHGLSPDASLQSMPDKIRVAVEHIDDETSYDSSSASSISGGSDSEPGTTTLQPQGTQHKSTQRRRWTREEEKVLRRLKSTQSRNKGLLSDCEIASRLGRSENGVKQHWDIMLQKNRRGC
ncbi:hypothetical protein FOVG_17682 [Fusarium oxysporum f. sp. pisi HDV247]|uniref:Myb-like domain-containing protein n=1 Tax=Fusarium oxysporum f. sp. pisi HDV247 TaxID=1080344 RepID=W9NE11_FUSOX|nr:hypothetical protein FOVG_17682 [Fusarium oxysporum f. sp. pisi HDV247]